MSKDKPEKRGQYADVVGRLEAIVQALEAGDLSLEDSLARFAEGVQLVKSGEQLLSDAEKKVEQLLSDEGRTAPLKLAEVPDAPKAPPPPATKAAAKRSPTADELEDVPF